MNRLKQWLREWLEITPDAQHEEARRLWSAMHREIREARQSMAELIEAERVAIERLHREVVRIEGRFTGTSHGIAAASDQAMHAMLLADQKVDALAALLGIVLTPPMAGSDDTEVKATAIGMMERALAERTVLVALELRKARGIVGQTRAAALEAESLGKRMQKALEQAEARLQEMRGAP